ncbi:MAG: hypothetical protein MHPSP_001522 [Paramarteilia canceri]
MSETRHNEIANTLNSMQNSTEQLQVNENVKNQENEDSKNKKNEDLTNKETEDETLLNFTAEEMKVIETINSIMAELNSFLDSFHIRFHNLAMRDINPLFDEILISNIEDIDQKILEFDNIRSDFTEKIYGRVEHEMATIIRVKDSFNALETMRQENFEIRTEMERVNKEKRTMQIKAKVQEINKRKFKIKDLAKMKKASEESNQFENSSMQKIQDLESMRGEVFDKRANEVQSYVNQENVSIKKNIELSTDQIKVSVSDTNISTGPYEKNVQQNQTFTSHNELSENCLNSRENIQEVVLKNEGETEHSGQIYYKPTQDDKIKETDEKQLEIIQTINVSGANDEYFSPDRNDSVKESKNSQIDYESEQKTISQALLDELNEMDRPLFEEVTTENNKELEEREETAQLREKQLILE